MTEVYLAADPLGVLDSGTASWPDLLGVPEPGTAPWLAGCHQEDDQAGELDRPKGSCNAWSVRVKVL